MQSPFDMAVARIKEIEALEPQKNALVALLQNYGAKTLPKKEPHILGALPYVAQFLFEGSGMVTIYFCLMDWQTDSDVVITNMTSFPQISGYGKRAITNLLQWARDNSLKEVRATQVHESNEGFWLKNGFEKCPPPNPCNDFVFPIL